ncbi:MAG: putative toxin-antitoxin system toxin component, PIN family [Solirubrobacterales bacterium]
MRAIFDPNVLISAILSPNGTPATLLRSVENGDFELVVTPALLAELERALEYPKLETRIDPARLSASLSVIRRVGKMVADPASGSSISSPDPKDAYLLSLAETERIALVTGDKALQALAGKIPVFSPASFLELLEAGRS